MSAGLENRTLEERERAAAERERAAAERERAAAAALEAVERMRSELASCVSHELRTPITSILGYAELLDEGVAGPLSDEQAAMVSAVVRNSHRLLGLIEDLLTVARVESGVFRIDRRAGDLAAVVAGARAAVDPLLEGRRLDIVVDVPPGPLPVLADPVQLERAVVNLLINAVRFTDDGGTVRVTVTAGADELQVVVADTGIGVPYEEQDGLFTAFFRSSVAQRRETRGIGLGLVIARSIVEAHEGRVSLTSTPGAGTTVVVALPAYAGRD